MMDHVFIVFTKADTYFKADSADNLREYLEDLRCYADKSILSEFLNIIGDRIIAVENECMGYKRSLIRDAVLGLIRRSAPRCYTIEYFKDGQEEIEKQLTSKSENRRQQMHDLEMEIIELVLDFLTEKDLKYVIELRKNIGLTLLTQLSRKVKTSVVGLSDFERPDVVRTSIKRVLQTQIPLFLKESFQNLVAQHVPNPQKSTREIYCQVQSKEPDLVNLLEREFVTRTIELRIEKVKVDCALAYISENPRLKGCPLEIQKKLTLLYGESFMGRDATQLINDCLESEDVQWACEGRRESQRQRGKLELYDAEGRPYSQKYQEGWSKWSNMEDRKMNHGTVERGRRGVRKSAHASLPSLPQNPPPIHRQYSVPMAESRGTRHPSPGLRRRLEEIEGEKVTRRQLKEEAAKKEKEERKQATTAVIRATNTHVSKVLATKTRTEAISCKTKETYRSKMFEQVTRDVRVDVGMDIVDMLPREEISCLVKDVLDATVDKITEPSFMEKCGILVTSIFSLSIFKKALGLGLK